MATELEKLSNSPIFIAGSQRTGTTLLCRILNAHPNLFISNEIPPVTKSIPKPGFSRTDFLSFFEKGIEKEYGLPLAKFLEKENKIRWGLKMPWLIYHIDSLIRVFPDCKIVLLIRDGRAYANSLLRTKWGHANIYYVAKLWVSEMEIVKEKLNSNPDRILCVRYENLMRHTQPELKSVCDFIGEKYTNDLLDYTSSQSYISKKPTNVNVFNKINPDFISKWEKELTKFQQNVFETIAGDVLIANDYPLKAQKININPLLRTWFRIHHAIVGEIQLQRKRKLYTDRTLPESIMLRVKKLL